MENPVYGHICNCFSMRCAAFTICVFSILGVWSTYTVYRALQEPARLHSDDVAVVNFVIHVAYLLLSVLVVCVFCTSFSLRLIYVKLSEKYPKKKTKYGGRFSPARSVLISNDA